MTCRAAFLPIIQALIAVWLLAGCFGFSGEEGISYRALPADRGRLVFGANALRGATVRHKVAKNPATGQHIERARWDARSGVTAELMLVEAPDGARSPPDPRNLAADFPGLIRLEAAFGELYESETSVGTALWRRFVAGDRTCMIFRQDLTARAEVQGARILSGYYCAKPGGTFTVLDAAATLRTVGLRQT